MSSCCMLLARDDTCGSAVDLSSVVQAAVAVGEDSLLMRPYLCFWRVGRGAAIRYRMWLREPLRALGWRPHYFGGR
jgi:hypothetical protein